MLNTLGGRDESALQNNYSPSPHSKCSKIIDLFAVGEALFYYDDDLLSDTQRFYIRNLVGPEPTSV
jgi:hypothetical protein